MKTNTKKVRARRLARWMNRLAQAGLIHLTGYVFYKHIPIPIAHPYENDNVRQQTS